MELPPVNGFKLNCDAAVNQSSGRDTVGGVFRNHQGAVLFCFPTNIGICSLVATELWVILYGIRVA